MSRVRSISSWAGGAVLAIAASAGAQDPEIAAQKAQQLSSGSAEQLKGKDEGEVSPERQFEQAKAYLRKMQETVRRGEKKKQEAKKQKDLIKLNCLNEKISQAQAHMQDAEQSMSALSEALVRNDSAQRGHEFARIRIFYQKVLVLGAEADSCAGEDSGYVGPSQIEVDVDPTIPQGDPTDPGLPSPNFTTPPPGVEEAASDSPFDNPQP